jgi:hypothetical protein
MSERLPLAELLSPRTVGSDLQESAPGYLIDALSDLQHRDSRL